MTDNRDLMSEQIITKDKMVTILQQKGFTVSNTSGVIMVEYIQGKYHDTYKEIKKFVRESGYEASFGLICSIKGKDLSVQQIQTEHELKTETTEVFVHGAKNILTEDYSIFEDSDGQLSLF